MTDSPIIKTFIVVIFIMIVLSLGAAFLSLFRGRNPDSTATVKALTIRVALSVGLIILIAILNALGIITPNH